MKLVSLMGYGLCSSWCVYKKDISGQKEHLLATVYLKLSFALLDVPTSSLRANIYTWSGAHTVLFAKDAMGIQAAIHNKADTDFISFKSL